MYLQHYGLKEQPFGVTPNPRYLYLGTGHRETLASLIYGVEAGVGFAALIAAPGLGKTTLLFYLLERFRASARTAFIFQTQCSRVDLLRYLANEFELPSDSSDPVMLHGQIRDLLVREARQNRRVIVVVDEAQNLGADSLETIRLLSDFETPNSKLLHIILAGQPELATRLSQPGMSQLLQRLAMVNHLQPLSIEDTRSYLDYRLGVAGYRGAPLFTPAAVNAVARFSGGVPRNINRIAFNALSLGYALKRKQIEADLIREVGEDLGVAAALVEEGPDGPLENLPFPEEPEATRAANRSSADIAPRPAIHVDGAAPVAIPLVAVSPSPAPAVSSSVQAAATTAAAKPQPRATVTKPMPLAGKKRSHVGSIALCATAGVVLFGGLLFWQRSGTTEAVESASTVPATAMSSAPAVSLPQSDASEPTPPLALSTGQPAATPKPVRPSVPPKGPTTSVRVVAATSVSPPVPANNRSNPAPPSPILQPTDNSPRILVPSGAGSSAASSRPEDAVPPRISMAGLARAPLDLGVRSAPVLAPRTSSGVVPATLVRKIDPVYPAAAQQAGVSGIVVLGAVIGRDGRPRDVRVVSGNPLLAQAAADAVRKWVYRPYLLNGQPTEVGTQITVSFALNETPR